MKTCKKCRRPFDGPWTVCSGCREAGRKYRERHEEKLRRLGVKVLGKRKPPSGETAEREEREKETPPAWCARCGYRGHDTSNCRRYVNAVRNPRLPVRVYND